MRGLAKGARLAVVHRARVLHLLLLNTSVASFLRRRHQWPRRGCQALAQGRLLLKLVYHSRSVFSFFGYFLSLLAAKSFVYVEAKFSRKTIFDVFEFKGVTCDTFALFKRHFVVDQQRDYDASVAAPLDARYTAGR